MSSNGTLIVISAPSGSGKTSLARRLLDRVPDLEFSVSHTTRRPREGEEDGVQYFFVSVARFEEMIQAGAFLEHARVHGNYYGTSAEFVRRRLQAGKDVLLDIDVQGARQVTAVRGDLLSIFILPPSAQVLEQRLRERAQDTPEVIERRLAVARREASHFRDYQYLIINEELEKSVAELQSIVLAARCRTPDRSERAAAILATFER